MAIAFDAELWRWDARRDDSWTFVSLPVAVSGEIRESAVGPPRGFGSIRVRATIGGSVWTTSIFPDAKGNCYVLPVKRAVRKAEDLNVGEVAAVTIELLDAGAPPSSGGPARKRMPGSGNARR
jgi:hypothetical protein